jgi:Protein of unknown function (DUF2690)
LKKIVGHVSIVVILVAIIGVGFLVTAKPAHAAANATCRGQSCNGQDPDTMGCGADAQTLSMSSTSSPTYGGLTLQIRYSPTCQALWPRLVGSGCLYGDSNPLGELTLGSYGDESTTFTAERFCAGAWGNMAYASSQTGEVALITYFTYMGNIEGRKLSYACTPNYGC